MDLQHLIPVIQHWLAINHIDGGAIGRAIAPVGAGWLIGKITGRGGRGLLGGLLGRGRRRRGGY